MVGQALSLSLYSFLIEKKEEVLAFDSPIGVIYQSGF